MFFTNLYYKISEAFRWFMFGYKSYNYSEMELLVEGEYFILQRLKDQLYDSLFKCGYTHDEIRDDYRMRNLNLIIEMNRGCMNSKNRCKKPDWDRYCEFKSKYALLIQV